MLAIALLLVVVAYIVLSERARRRRERSRRFVLAVRHAIRTPADWRKLKVR